MSLPASRNESYVDGVTIIPAATMNDIQDNIVDGFKYFRDGHVLVDDEFTGTAINTGMWHITGSPTVSDDSQDGAFGIAQFAAASRNIATGSISLADKEWGFTARCKFPSFGSWPGTAVAQFGLPTSGLGLAKTVRFSVTAGGSIHVETSVDTNTGIAPSTSSYQTFQARRIGTTVKCYVDNVEVVSETFNLDNAQAVIGMFTANGTLYLDLFRLWVSR